MRQKMLPVRCNKNSPIKLARNKPKVVIVFWMLFHGNMTTAALRHAVSLNLGSYTRKKHLSRQNSRTLLDLQSKPITNCNAEPKTAMLPVVCAPGVITNEINASL